MRDVPPVKLKVYGLISMTKAAYLSLQCVGFGVLLMVLIVVTLMPLDPARFQYPAVQWVIEHLQWLVIGVMVLELLETLAVLSRFRRKEHETSAFQGKL